MGGFLDKPKTEKFFEEGEQPGFRYVVANMQGWRKEMEDTHVAKTNLGDEPSKLLRDWSYFAVFDGHLGKTVSNYCADHLLDTILSGEEFETDVQRGIYNGFLKLDGEIESLPHFRSGADKSGSTAVCCFITPKVIYLANCGDSRAIICRSGECILSTVDHQPRNDIEWKRIYNAGGRVKDSRVNGNLAVSRSLGDYDYKRVEGKGPLEQLVTAEPDIFVTERNINDEFIVLACDGIWEKIENDQLCKYIRSRLLITDNLQEIASQVMDTCLVKGSKDNMTLILIVFPAAPKPLPEAVKAEAELEGAIEKCIKDFVEGKEKEKGSICFLDMRTYVGNNVENLLPPGGGIHSKSILCQRIYERLYPDLARDDMYPQYF